MSMNSDKRDQSNQETQSTTEIGSNNNHISIKNVVEGVAIIVIAALVIGVFNFWQQVGRLEARLRSADGSPIDVEHLKDEITRLEEHIDKSRNAIDQKYKGEISRIEEHIDNNLELINQKIDYK